MVRTIVAIGTIYFSYSHYDVKLVKYVTVRRGNSHTEVMMSFAIRPAS